MFNRRQLLKFFASLPLVGGAAATGLYGTPAGREISPRFRNRDYFTELGVRTLINGRGVVTTLTGSLMPPEVVKAMSDASTQFVNLIELNEKAGSRIAEMLNCDDAIVTAGAASALTLGTAAALTGTDREKIRRLPDLPGPRREVIMPRGHRVFEQQITACGVKIVEVEGPEEMERRINENTALAFFFNASSQMSISHEEFVQIGKRHGIPTFNDCASDVPPPENLFKYIEMGFDMVTFSGGKGLCGPQSTGLLYGRKDLIEAARLNHSPYGSIGRGMKVDKEEIIGLMVALELYLSRDHEAERARWHSWTERIAEQVRSVPGVQTETYLPPVANRVPHLKITWDESVVEITPPEVVQKLRHGHPSIETLGGSEDIIYNMFMLQPHEIDVVARRTREILEEAV